MNKNPERKRAKVVCPDSCTLWSEGSVSVGDSRFLIRLQKSISPLSLDLWRGGRSLIFVWVVNPSVVPSDSCVTDGRSQDWWCGSRLRIGLGPWPFRPRPLSTPVLSHRSGSPSFLFHVPLPRGPPFCPLQDRRVQKTLTLCPSSFSSFPSPPF